MFSAYTSLFFHTLLSLYYTNHLHSLDIISHVKKDVVEGEDEEEAEEVVVAVDVPIMHLTMVPFWN